MTPQALAQIHGQAFIHGRAWSAQEFETLLSNTYVALYAQSAGFALTRTLARESELLTLAVAPTAQRQGLARTLCQSWLADIAGTADMAFLEVAADNLPALALYRSLGFAETGKRKGYYARKGAAPVDALVMQLPLTTGQPDESPQESPKSG